MDYLQETACQGFPDMLKQATNHANEILHMRSGNPSAAVGQHWID